MVSLGDLLAFLGLVWYTALWLIGLLGCYTARKRYRVRPRSPLCNAPASSVPGVSILRPLKGLDTNLFENLEAAFLQDYPKFEILFTVDSPHDQALSVTQPLLLKYPHVKARVIISGSTAGINPKVNSLLPAYQQAAYDILWVLDSNITVDRGTLARAVDILEPPSTVPQPKKRIGLVHHVPLAYTTESASGSLIEEAFLNTNHAKMYIALNTLAIESCVMGKSNFYRRSDLDRVNGSLKPHPPQSQGDPGLFGLAAFANYLAEDNMIGTALWHELDLRHDLSCDVARNVVGKMSVKDYIDRRVRWIRVRKHMVLAATLMEPFTESFMLCFIACVSLRHVFNVPVWLTVLLHFIPWLWVDLDVYCSISGHSLEAEHRWKFLRGWVGRELLALPIFLYAVFGRNVVHWRGRDYILSRNGAIQPEL